MHQPSTRIVGLEGDQKFTALLQRSCIPSRWIGVVGSFFHVQDVEIMAVEVQLNQNHISIRKSLCGCSIEDLYHH